MRVIKNAKVEPVGIEVQYLMMRSHVSEIDEEGLKPPQILHTNELKGQFLDWTVRN